MLISGSEVFGGLGGVRVVDARPGGAYALGHIHGAVHADLERDLSGPAEHPERGGRHPLPDATRFAETLGAWGIGPDTDVVIYDERTSAMAAARLWWMLRAVGHDRVRILDGGLEAARAAGVPIDRDPPSVTPRPPYPATSFERPTVAIDEVRARAGDPGWVVLDVRETARYAGETEPIDPVAGHIPGAVNLFFGENLEPDGRFRPPAVLASRYRALFGDVPPERVIVHCGSGVTACHTLLALELAGIEGAALYVGSWSEWCRQLESTATTTD